MSTGDGKFAQVTVKKEPLGNGSLDSARLSSFGVPRDLTLGGSGALRGRGAVNKKVFTPNLNVVRNKNTNVKTSKDTSSNRGRNRPERGKSDRGRGRGRGSLVQTSGVFSEGAGAVNIRKSSSFRPSGGNDDNPSSVLLKPTLIKKESKIDIKAEANHIREFIGDSDDDFDGQKTDLDNIPIKLSQAKWNKLKVKVEKDDPVNEIKSENYNERNEHIVEHSKQTGDILTFPHSVDDLFTRINAQLFLLQLPDSLPCVDTIDDSPKTSTSKEVATSERNPPVNVNSLNALEEGQIGKLVRYKSGRCKLTLGETPFNLDIGMESGFLQDLMSISANREERSGNMINLGPIQAKLTATPDWEHLFKENSS